MQVASRFLELAPCRRGQGWEGDAAGQACFLLQARMLDGFLKGCQELGPSDRFAGRHARHADRWHDAPRASEKTAVISRDIRVLASGEGLLQPHGEDVDVPDFPEHPANHFSSLSRSSIQLGSAMSRKARSSLLSRRVVVRRRWMPSWSPRLASASVDWIRSKASLMLAWSACSAGSPGLIRGSVNVLAEMGMIPLFF